jgi:hypothetical protein
MLIVGQVTDEEDRYEVRLIAELFIVGERFRYLARQQKKK